MRNCSCLTICVCLILALASSACGRASKENKESTEKVSWPQKPSNGAPLAFVFLKKKKGDGLYRVFNFSKKPIKKLRGELICKWKGKLDWSATLSVYDIPKPGAHNEQIIKPLLRKFCGSQLLPTLYSVVFVDGTYWGEPPGRLPTVKLVGGPRIPDHHALLFQGSLRVGRKKGSWLSATLYVAAKANSLTFRFSSKKAATLSLAGRTAKFVNGALRIEIPLLDLFSRVRASLLGEEVVTKDSYGKEVPARLYLPISVVSGKLTQKGQLSVKINAVGDLFSKRVQNGGVRFPGESPAPAKKRVLLNGISWSRRGLSGKDSLRSVDTLAVVYRSERKLGTCRYRGKGGLSKNLDRIAEDVVAELWDRRSGKKLASRRWKAKPPKCNRTITARDKGAFRSWTSTRPASEWIDKTTGW